MFRNTYAEIHLENLKSNVEKLKDLAGDHFFCPMVKANAYGHGAVQISKALESLEVDGFGVALLEEAIELKKAGLLTPILHFGPFKKEHVPIILKNSIVPVITSYKELTDLAHFKKPVEIHLKIDTEMNRLGLKAVSYTHLTLPTICSV